MHVLLAAVGLSAIIATSASVFTFVRWVGAAYLIWLGIQAFSSDGASYSSAADVKKTSNIKIFQQGILVAALNPKVAIFFLAFLPQFVVTGAGPASAQLFLHGCLIIVIAAFIEPPLVILGAKLMSKLNQNSRMDRGLDTIVIGLGVRLALSEQT